MSSVSRRSVLFGAAAGVAVAVSGVAGVSTPKAKALGGIAFNPKRVAISREDHRVIVIGSGFGGGVSALRLAQAGVPVLVLERGLRWPTGPNATTFPLATAPDKRILWYESAPTLFGKPTVFAKYAGLLEACVGDNITAICAAGVGGGSLIYQGMTLQPARDVFNSQLPDALDWDTMNQVHYPRVAQMLQIAVAPDALINSTNYTACRIFADHVNAAGLPLSKIPMPIDWQFALDELDGKMAPSYTDGSGALGVNNGGKHSIDVTYLAAAEATGNCTIAPLHNVTDVERASDGRWTIYVDRTDSDGNVVENKILTTPALIMAAGSMNTTRLLVRAAGKGKIPNMPSALGTGWGTNGDRIYTWTPKDATIPQPEGGPVVYGSLNWSDPTRAATMIQASLPPLQANPNTTMMVGFGVSNDRGKMVYNASSDTADLKWPKNGDSALFNNVINPLAQKIAGGADNGNMFGDSGSAGSSSSGSGVLGDTNLTFNSTWHALGGAPMGTVCDLDGRVIGQRGLYVLDGALIPGNTAACNPSMTIAAVAERALDNIVRSDVGTII